MSDGWHKAEDGVHSPKLGLCWAYASPRCKRLYNYYKVNGAVGIWILVKHCSLEFHWSVVFRYAIESISPLVYYD